MDTTTVNMSSSEAGLSSGGDLTAYFPEIEISIWDKVGEIKKQIKDYRGFEAQQANKIRQELAQFHKKHPEFLNNLDEARKK